MATSGSAYTYAHPPAHRIPLASIETAAPTLGNRPIRRGPSQAISEPAARLLLRHRSVHTWQTVDHSPDRQDRDHGAGLAEVDRLDVQRKQPAIPPLPR